jgi:hypothetical protein
MSLLEDMKKVFSQCFEEKPGNRMYVSQLHNVFETSARILSESEKGVFFRHGNTIFKKTWPNARLSTWKHDRCFVNVAVKPVASPPDYSEVYVLELAQNKVYVGVSDDVERSIQEHLEGNGCDFTRMYETTAVLLPRLGNAAGTINEQHHDETIRNMMKYGIVNVRGWKYSSVVMSEDNINEAMADIAAHLRD